MKIEGLVMRKGSINKSSVRPTCLIFLKKACFADPQDGRCQRQCLSAERHVPFSPSLLQESTFATSPGPSLLAVGR